MSLRRSARNSAKAAVPEVQKGPDLNGQTSHATSVVDADGDAVRGEDFHVPLPESRAKNNVRKKARVTTDAEVTKKKAATPKKASAPRKRKALAIEPEASTGMITNVANLGEVPAGTDASPELVSKESPEVLASTNGVKPSEILTVPNGSYKFNGSTSPSSRHDPLSASDIPRSSEKGIDHPSTPVPKRQRKANSYTKSPLKPVPFTPTPSDVDPIAGSRNTVRTARKSKPKAADHMLDDLASVNRPAAADVTNAPVLTPRGSQVVVNDSPARKRKAADLPPDVGSPLKPANSTTETLLRDAEAFLIRVDETGKLEGLIERQHCKLFSPEGLSEVVDPFTALASGIMGQQVSGAAAASIRKKFTALFSDTHPAFPSPSAVLTKDIPALRTAGLSQRKAEYITGLAEKFASGEFTAEGLVSASDEELIEKLVAVRGLGRWSVEMFACFGLKRTDVFSTGDLGVQRGMAAYMGRDVSKLKNKGGKWKYMSEQEMLSTASKFSPYRSLFMWYMWRIADVETEVLE